MDGRSGGDPDKDKSHVTETLKVRAEQASSEKRQQTETFAFKTSQRSISHEHTYC